MDRNIFIVTAQIIDANGTFNPLTGYPKNYDSRQYGGNIEAALWDAKSEYFGALKTLYKRTDRKMQTVMLTSADGTLIERKCLGAVPADPDPEPEPEQEPEE